MKVTDNEVGSVGGSIILNIKEKRWQEMYNEIEVEVEVEVEVEEELTLSEYIGELDVPDEVLEDNVFGL